MRMTEFLLQGRSALGDVGSSEDEDRPRLVRVWDLGCRVVGCPLRKSREAPRPSEGHIGDSYLHLA